MRANPSIKSEIWHYPDAREVFFAETEYTQHHFPPHFHEHYVFFCVTKGVNEGSFPKKKYAVTPNDFLIIHPGEIHSGNSFSNRLLKYHTFCPTEKFLVTALQSMELGALPSFTPIISDAGIIIQKFNSLINNSATQAGNFLLEQSLTDFLGSLMERTKRDICFPNTKKVFREKINKAKKFIEDNYTNHFSLAELSRHTGLSSYHLLRSFKACIGLTPHGYLNNFRAEMAKRKMSEKISLTRLAHHSGFYDQSHFIRHFKKINGIAPSGFRQ
jgi:AraC-like DNA-binding protein